MRLSFLSLTLFLIVGAVGTRISKGIVESQTTDDRTISKALFRRETTPSSSGVEDGFYYDWWTDGTPPNALYTNQGGGTFSITWKGGIGDLIGGKGWNVGTTDRIINYNGTYVPSGAGYLMVYGWTRNPLIAYYIVESYGSPYYPGSAGLLRGSMTCNGGKYDALVMKRTDSHSIDGVQSFTEYWSFRNPKKYAGGLISGTVDVACHFEAWKRFGMELGSEMSYQIMAVEGYFSSGSATITVS